jgi:hypothetical protein
MAKQKKYKPGEHITLISTHNRYKVMVVAVEKETGEYFYAFEDKEKGKPLEGFSDNDHYVFSYAPEYTSDTLLIFGGEDRVAFEEDELETVCENIKKEIGL